VFMFCILFIILFKIFCVIQPYLYDADHVHACLDGLVVSGRQLDQGLTAGPHVWFSVEFVLLQTYCEIKFLDSYRGHTCVLLKCDMFQD